MSDIFRVEQKPNKREVMVKGVICSQNLDCDYCGWEINLGDPLNVVIIDDYLKFYCSDDERCASQAGK